MNNETALKVCQWQWEPRVIEAAMAAAEEGEKLSTAAKVEYNMALIQVQMLALTARLSGSSHEPQGWCRLLLWLLPFHLVHRGTLMRNRPREALVAQFHHPDLRLQTANNLEHP